MNKGKIAIFKYFFLKKRGIFFILRSLAIPFCILTLFVKHVKEGGCKSLVQAFVSYNSLEMCYFLLVKDSDLIHLLS